LRAWINFRQGLALASHSSPQADSLDDTEYRLGKLAVSYFHHSDDDINIADAVVPGLMQSSDTWLDEDKSTMRSAYYALAAPPLDKIKMLNNGEKDKLNLLIQADNHAADLYRSILRGMVFSPIQNRLTQSLRDHPDIAPDMATIMPAEDQDMYSAWLTEWHDILDVARGCIQTACQRLIEARDMQGLHLLTRQLSDQARKELASLMLDHGLSDASNDISSETLFAVLDQSKTAPTLKTECAQIKLTARGYRRAGLKQAPAGLNDLSIWYDHLYQAAELAETIIAELNQFLEHMATIQHLKDQFKQDHNAFSEQFTSIYLSEGYHDKVK
jgi:hypothetical protein